MTLSRTAYSLIALPFTLQPTYADESKDELTKAHSSRLGPLIVQSQAPLQITGLTPLLHDPTLLKNGETDVFASAAIASVWANTPEYQFDYYHNQFMVGFLHAPSDANKIGVWYQYRYAANNRLDGLTEKFHSMFGIDQNGRTEVDEDRFFIDLPNDNSAPREDFVGDPLLSAINLYGEHTVYRSAHHAVSVGATLFFNRVSRGTFANTSFEQGLQINYGYQRNKHHVTASLAIVYRPDKPQHFVSVKSTSMSGGISYQYQWRKNHEFIGEYLLSQAKTDTESLGELNAPVHEFALGYRYLFDASALELVALENMFNHDNSTDIVFTATFRHRLML
ncbi:DUF3187 family protein [Enterovibrio sp. ZSDZ42]|uniref:DUF3187 family protein n=1 Tax=Enterovibrio gelatinilyticus TaxID=2899819 RepID=A0ABT5R6K3_9GAMM|nr:DUF3187 family protein [Enterovibrio sp. ZSDZ42]MDD1795904.1 DUF3187 family protein [Enterovibrio sp. ZSDZ42]